jgi:hypothetical protein
MPYWVGWLLPLAKTVFTLVHLNVGDDPSSCICCSGTGKIFYYYLECPPPTNQLSVHSPARSLDLGTGTQGTAN